MRTCVIVCALGILGSTPFAVAAGPEPAALERFEKKVRPLLAAKCWSCHGSEKTKGGLRLDSGSGVTEGGDSGPVLVPGDPEKSRLIEAVRYVGELRMPPKGKLSDAEVAELVEWVRSGAHWPEDKTPTTPVPTASPVVDDARTFWAFQPPRDPLPPSVKATDWPQSPVDRFVLAKLEAKGLAPAPPAEKRLLIRRATFDLTGLPPTPDEVSAFLADETPEAFARVVDRLLASPHYGERWGRHWLDLARYADSNGMDENVAYANAYRYRDYVIRAFNRDKPYDQFLREQLAGDLLPRSDGDAEGYDRLTATGFLVLGPKMLAEDDPVKMEMDIIDEQVDTVGRVFMGLTLGCARCHDHKFDPIPTADYYALAGIFKSTKSMQNHRVVAMWNERTLASAAELAAADTQKKESDRRNGEIQSLVESAKKALGQESRSRLGDYLLAAWQLDQVAQLAKSPLAASAPPKGMLLREAEAFNRGNVAIDTSNYGREIGVIYNKGELPNWVEYDLELAEAGAYQVELRFAAASPRPVRLKINGALKTAEAAKTATGSWNPDTQTWTAEGLYALPEGRVTLRLECDGPFPHFDKVALVPRLLPDGLTASDLKSPDDLGRERSLNPRLIERWKDVVAHARSDPNSAFRAWHDREGMNAVVKAALDRPPLPATRDTLARRYQELFDEASRADASKQAAEPALATFRRVLDDPAGPFAVPKEPERYFPPETTAQLQKLRGELAEFTKKAIVLPATMGVEDQKVTNLRIHIRGSHLTLGAEEPRHFPAVLSSEKPTPLDASRSGRLELADWLARPKHPLTARVMVNRIWLGHFGAGLVRSPDNFGRLGDQPVHVELLDWLAQRFIASGWSIKAMHRVIMLSSTYQMSTRYDAHAALADPENRLHWRMDRRRLEAEAIRDALLAVSGELEGSTGGTLLKTGNHAYVNNTGPRGNVLYDVNRRSIYLPVIRSGLYDVFQAFDFADPSTSNGQRVATTVAPQALFMLNDRLVLRTSEAMARRLLALPGLADADRLERAYRSAYGRPPTEPERLRALDYLHRFDSELTAEGIAPEARPLRAWQSLCQALLGTNEFIYLD